MHQLAIEKRQSLVYAMAIIALSTLDGCTLAGDIFKAGFWVAIIAVLLVAGLVGGAVALLRR
jgi:hypothetical protein